ncbi:hypothetical protein SJI00_13615 [Pseudomonas sp. RP23018S]|uniref:hypothetical protein n=1 Tax=Pseudomonas sp. RP23018S TaxID=3096037 RepID=UPI002ACA5F20|nr:hypothetical protein [Pseudomonas sp. RP23018S]MDZ5603815.1 hypothetical protein [Pseudomonas sp. RP23018S]
MDAQQFVALWKAEKAAAVQSLHTPATQVSAQLAAMQLSEVQTRQLHALLDGVLTDVMYTLLLGLDGCASIGGEQHDFSLRNEAGEPIDGLQSEAYEQFHGAA